MEISNEDLEVNEDLKKKYTLDEIISLFSTQMGASIVLTGFLAEVFKGHDNFIPDNVKYWMAITLANIVAIKTGSNDISLNMHYLTSEKDYHTKYLYVIETFYKDLVKRALLKNDRV